MHLGTKDHYSATNQACLVPIGTSQHFLALLGTSWHFLAPLGNFGIRSESFKEPSEFTDCRRNPFGIVPTPITLSLSYHPYTYSLIPALFTSAYLPITYLGMISGLLVAVKGPAGSPLTSS